MVMKQRFIHQLAQLNLRKEKSVACIGFFDGVHLGHQALINKTKQRAEELDLPTMLITFDPDPWSVIHGKQNVKHITPLKRKIEIIKELGIDEMIVLTFNKDFSNLSPEDFVFKVLMALGVEELVVGEDFKFGHRGKGDVTFLKEHYANIIPTHAVSLLTSNDTKIGSTSITQTILNGQLEKTKELLGRNYRISGIVIDGAKQGRKIGFPTANLDIYDEYVIPKAGVYAGYTIVNDTRYKSIINIGYNPTFNTREKISIETHILDFDAFIYGQVIHQEFEFRLRDEIKFETVDALIEQMKEDKEIALKKLK